MTPPANESETPETQLAAEIAALLWHDTKAGIAFGRDDAIEGGKLIAEHVAQAIAADRQKITYLEVLVEAERRSVKVWNGLCVEVGLILGGHEGDVPWDEWLRGTAKFHANELKALRLQIAHLKEMYNRDTQ